MNFATPPLRFSIGRALSGLFEQMLRLTLELGGRRLGRVAVDGTKVKADASDELWPDPQDRAAVASRCAGAAGPGRGDRRRRRPAPWPGGAESRDRTTFCREADSRACSGDGHDVLDVQRGEITGIIAVTRTDSSRSTLRGNTESVARKLSEASACASSISHLPIAESVRRHCGVEGLRLFVLVVLHRRIEG